MKTIMTAIGLAALAATAAAGPPKQDAALARKLNPIIGAINDATPAVARDRDEYLGWVADAKAGPTCHEKNLTRPYPLQFAASVAKDVAAAAKAKPKLKELDAAATDYAAAMAKLDKLSSEASTYYGDRKYQDDACARGKSLHAELIAAWAQLLAGDHGIRVAVQALEDAADARDLPPLLKKFGKKLRWHHRALVIEGKHLLRALQPLAAAAEHAVGPAPAPELGPVRAELEAFAAMVAVAKELAEGSSRVDADVSHFNEMVYPAGQLVEAATELVARLDGSKPYSEDDKRRLAKGDDDFPGGFQRVVSAYNSLVGASNAVSFSGKMK